MKKIRKILPLILISALCLTGCKKHILDGPGMVNSQTPVTSELPGTTLPTEFFNTDPVQKGNAVIYDNQLLFRYYPDPSVDRTGLFGDFSTALYPYEGNELYTYDLTDPNAEAEFLTRDNGYGDFYLVGNTLYSQAYKEDYISYVYKRNLPDGKEERIANGQIVAFAPDGKSFLITDFTSSGRQFFVYDTETATEKYKCVHANEDSLRFVGMSDDYTFFMKSSNSSEEYKEEIEYSICQYANDGTSTNLGTFSVDAVNDIVVDPDFLFDDQEQIISFTLHYYQGSGHFYYESASVSVPFDKDNTPTTEPVYETDVSTFTRESDPSYELEDSLSHYVGEFPNESGFRQFVQSNACVTSAGTFFVIADAHRNSINDIGWRYSYDLLNMHYYFETNDGTLLPLKDMYQPGGSLGTLDDLPHYYDAAPTITALVSVIGTPNGEIEGLFYQVIEVQGVEADSIDYSLFYSAEFSDEFHFEVCSDESIYDWSIENFETWKESVSQYPDHFISSVPNPVSADGYEVNDNLSFEKSFCYHLGFDENGKINYIRPVVFD